MGLLESLQIGRKALGAASAGINVVSNNVANVNTPGYSRRSLTTSTSDPVEQQGVFFGQGVDITGIVRVHDRYLGMRLVDAVGLQSRANTAEASLKLTESYFNDTSTTGLVEVYGAFYDAMTQLTSDPSNQSLRSVAVNAAESLSNTVSNIASGLQKSTDDFDSSYAAKFGQVNTLLTQIAQLNAAIGKTSDTQGNTDLLDKRDQLIRDLASLTGATAQLEANGQATVFIGGHAAVSGGVARSMSLVQAVGVAPVAYLSADGGTIDVSTDLGGELGGISDARNYTQSYLNRLDDFAFTFANSQNAIHLAGFDANGAAGGNMFVPPAALAGAAASMAVDPNLAANSSLLALAGVAGGGAGDDTNLQSILNFESSTAFTGGLTGLQFISSLTSDVGSDMAAVSADSSAQDAQVQDFDAMRTSISGVDSDEEAMRLIEFQSAYRAAAKVVTATDEMLRILTSLGS
jgi:flagellar hook-associated protein 1 FlgK